ncbi:hypothetical protein HYQ46_005510 [Verticillium longisporum]|nr:hypothetical protein HYQ44_002955 [Verticillium longisporum]KAG7152803.1 hypothetical protein HYQ46_005510 [Verticillium longisporum]
MNDDIRSNTRRRLDITRATNYRLDRSIPSPSMIASGPSRNSRSNNATGKKRSSSQTGAALPPASDHIRHPQPRPTRRHYQTGYIGVLFCTGDELLKHVQSYQARIRPLLPLFNKVLSLLAHHRFPYEDHA